MLFVCPASYLLTRPYRLDSLLAMTNEPTEILTRAQVAALFGVHPGTVSKWLEAGLIPAFSTPAGSTRYYRADIEAFLASSTRERVTAAS